MKSITGQYIHWDQELRLPDEIINLRRNPEFFDREASKRKPDICYYTKVKKGSEYVLNLNLIEVTIPWNDVEFHPENFDNPLIFNMFSNYLINMIITRIL
jgi:hypothetical protein